MTAFASPLGGLMLRPWYDRAAIPLLANLFFPLGRAWAAAEVAGLDTDAFLRETGGRRPAALVRRALARAERARSAHAAAALAWEAAVFNAGADPGPAVEAVRERAAFRDMAQRGAFLGLHALSPFPKVLVDIAGPEAARARHGGRLGAGAPFTPSPDPGAIERSRSLETASGRVFWLRGPERGGGDRLWARVSVAPGGERRPVLILAHGIAMEDEFWAMSRRAARATLASGLTLVQPEGPGHGRRRPAGRYGGETVFGGGPVGLMDYFFDHVRELGALVAWARAAFAAPVAVGGISLGALSAALLATAACDWPRENRPDGLFLVTPSADLRAVAFEGRLTRALDLIEPLERAGWTHDAIGDWLALLEPAGDACAPPETIVCVLGETDEVTPYATGLALARRWRVPDANVFTRPSGHFTTSLGLLREHAPLKHLARVLEGAASA